MARKQDPHINRNGIRIEGRRTREIEAEYYDGFTDSSNPRKGSVMRFKKCKTVVAYQQ